jgi:hypothetical protein
VVTDDPARAERWAAWLEHAGFETFACPGPGVAWNCPRVYGGRCVRREMVDAAVVDLACDEEASNCTTVPDDGTTVFVRSGGAAEPDLAGLVRAVAGVGERVVTVEV